MKKKPGKKLDLNELAASIVDRATNEDKPKEPCKPQKNQAAVELGRLGGLKGGKARKDALTPERRKEIAQEAARKRWGKEK